MSKEEFGYATYIEQAKQTIGGHLHIGRGGFTLHFGTSRPSGYDCDHVKSLCITAGLPVIDGREAPIELVAKLGVSGPMIAVNRHPDPRPWHALAYAGHEFMLQTCCEGLHEQIVRDMNDDPKWARHFIRSIGIEEICGQQSRRVADDGCCGLVLDWQLRLMPMTASSVKRFIGLHHAHCGIPVAWRFHNAVFNGATLIGVASSATLSPRP